MSKFNSPLRYPGGKSSIFSFVSKVFYENNMVGIGYAEPYAGGAGLALRLLFEEYVNHIYINDLDQSIYSFWKSITTKPKEFCDWIEGVEISVENWFKYKAIHLDPLAYNEFELAKATFFLNRTNVSGVIKGGIIGGIEQRGKYKIDARFNKADLIKKIQKVADFKHRISISNLDGLEFIKQMDKKNQDIFIYLDPPYYQKGGDLYMNFYNDKDHQKLSLAVNRMKKRWMVSYDHHDFILNLYGGKRKVTYKLSQSTSNRIGDEILVFSPNIDFNDSIKVLKAPILLSNTI